MATVPTRNLIAVAAAVVLSAAGFVSLADTPSSQDLEQLLDRVRETGDAGTVESARTAALRLPAPAARASALRELAAIQAGRGDPRNALATLAGAVEILEAHPGEVGIERARVLELEEKQEELQSEVRDGMREIQRIQKYAKEQVRKLDRQVVEFAVQYLVEEIEERFSGHEGVLEFEGAVRADIVDEGIALLTGRPSGERQNDGTYPEGSVNRAVDDRLRSLAETHRRFARSADNTAG